MGTNQEIRYPRIGVRIAGSMIAMLAGCIAQLIVVFVVSVAWVLTAMPSDDSIHPVAVLLIPLIVGMMWSCFSIIVIAVAWLFVYLPIYLLLYKKRFLDLYRWGFVFMGGALGFLIPYGSQWLIELYQNGFTMEWELNGYLSFAGLAMICGGVAAEVGWLMRKEALNELNPNLRGPRKTGPLKIMSEL